MEEKKKLYDLERHISFLSAPNYNLDIIFKDILHDQIETRNSRIENDLQLEYHKRNTINLTFIKEILEQENNKICNMIKSKEIKQNELKSRIDIVNQEKNELTEEIDQLEKALHLTNTDPEDPFNQGNGRLTTSSLQSDRCATLPELSSNTRKLKDRRINDLKATLRNLEKMIDEAKDKADQKRKKNELVINENEDLIERIKQKEMILEQAMSDIAMMKEKLGENIPKQSTQDKVKGFFKSIFKKKTI